MEQICSNDAFDAKTGVDTQERKPESIVNLTGFGAAPLLAIAFSALMVGLTLLMGPVSNSGSSLPGAMLLGSILCGYLYQGPPFRQVLKPTMFLITLSNCHSLLHPRTCAAAGVFERPYITVVATQYGSLVVKSWLIRAANFTPAQQPLFPMTMKRTFA